MKGRAVSGIMLILLSTLVLTGFNAPVLASGIDLTGEISIGAILPMTGGLATYGENSKVAIDFAVEEVNVFLQAAGANWTLKVLTEDTGTDPAMALTKLESFNAMGIKFVIGPMSSAEVSNIKGYADTNEILVVSQSSTRPDLNEPDDFLFRFCPTDFIQGFAIARLMYDDGITHVVAVWRGDIWGDGVESAVESRFEELGGTFIEDAKIRYDSAEREFSVEAAVLNDTVTSAIATYGADKVGVLYIAFDEVVAFFTAVSAYSTDGWGVKWYGSEGTVLWAEMIEDTAVADFSYQTGFINPIFAPTKSDKYEKVRAHILDVLGREPDSYAYIAYDIVWVYALSLLEVDAYDSDAVRAVLPTVAQNYFGASGWIVLDENGDRAFADYELWIITYEAEEYKWKHVGYYIQATDSVIWSPLTPTPVYVFEVVWNSKIFYIVVESNSTVSDFYFSQPMKEIGFDVTGPDGTISFCNVTIPKQLLDGEPWTVLIDNEPVTYIQIESGTHNLLYFTYTHSTHEVRIIGTHVIGPPPPVVAVTIDINPDTLNLRSKGEWITCYIELPEGYIISDIDVSSMLLTGAIPVDSDAPTEIGNYDEDDIPDLMVKFNRTAVTSYIQSVVGPQARFGVVTLTITGNLDDGTPFQGSTTIKTIYIDIETLAEKMLKYENYMQRV